MAGRGIETEAARPTPLLQAPAPPAGRSERRLGRPGPDPARARKGERQPKRPTRKPAAGTPRKKASDQFSSVKARVRPRLS